MIFSLPDNTDTSPMMCYLDQYACLLMCRRPCRLLFFMIMMPTTWPTMTQQDWPIQSSTRQDKTRQDFSIFFNKWQYKTNNKRQDNKIQDNKIQDKTRQDNKIRANYHTAETWQQAFVPERSKGAVSRTAIERCVGSNPTGCILLFAPTDATHEVAPCSEEPTRYVDFWHTMRRGCSSDGRAFVSHTRGKGIDTPHLHFTALDDDCTPGHQAKLQLPNTPPVILTVHAHACFWVMASVPEWSKGVDLSSTIVTDAWVRTPPDAF